MTLKIIIFSLGWLLLFSGCTSKRVLTSFASENNNLQKLQLENNPKYFRYKPIIGTKQDDTKVMIDMGQFAKIRINGYRNKNKTYVSVHDNITMIEEPGFIMGEDLPRNRGRTIQKTYGGRTFSYRSDDLMYQNSSMGNSGISEKEIKDYMNNHEESKKFKKVPVAKKVLVEKYNSRIKKFLKNRREDKNKNEFYDVNSVYSDPEEQKNGSLK